MSEQGYPAAISQAILAATGVYCYTEISPTVYARFSYMAIIANAVVGLCKWGKVDGMDLEKVSQITEATQDLFLLPCIVSTVWLQYNYIKELAFANILMSFIPLASFILEEKPVNDELKNTIVTVNISALTALSLLHDNFAGLSAMVIYAFAHIEIKKNKKVYFEMDNKDLYNYAMSLFAIMSVHTVCNI